MSKSSTGNVVVGGRGDTAAEDVQVMIRRLNEIVGVVKAELVNSTKDGVSKQLVLTFGSKKEREAAQNRLVTNTFKSGYKDVESWQNPKDNILHFGVMQTVDTLGYDNETLTGLGQIVCETYNQQLERAKGLQTEAPAVVAPPRVKRVEATAPIAGLTPLTTKQWSADDLSKFFLQQAATLKSSSYSFQDDDNNAIKVTFGQSFKERVYLEKEGFKITISPSFADRKGSVKPGVIEFTPDSPETRLNFWESIRSYYESKQVSAAPAPVTTPVPAPVPASGDASAPGKVDDWFSAMMKPEFDLTKFVIPRGESLVTPAAVSYVCSLPDGDLKSGRSSCTKKVGELPDGRKLVHFVVTRQTPEDQFVTSMLFVLGKGDTVDSVLCLKDSVSSSYGYGSSSVLQAVDGKILFSSELEKKVLPGVEYLQCSQHFEIPTLGENGQWKSTLKECSPIALGDTQVRNLARNVSSSVTDFNKMMNPDKFETTRPIPPIPGAILAAVPPAAKIIPAAVVLPATRIIPTSARKAAGGIVDKKEGGCCVIA